MLSVVSLLSRDHQEASGTEKSSSVAVRAVPGNPASLLLVSALTGSITLQGFHTEG